MCIHTIEVENANTASDNERNVLTSRLKEDKKKKKKETIRCRSSSSSSTSSSLSSSSSSLEEHYITITVCDYNHNTVYRSCTERNTFLKVSAFGTACSLEWLCYFRIYQWLNTGNHLLINNLLINQINYLLLTRLTPPEYCQVQMVMIGAFPTTPSPKAWPLWIEIHQVNKFIKCYSYNHQHQTNWAKSKVVERQHMLPTEIKKI